MFGQTLQAKGQFRVAWDKQVCDFCLLGSFFLENIRLIGSFLRYSVHFIIEVSRLGLGSAPTLSQAYKQILKDRRGEAWPQSAWMRQTFVLDRSCSARFKWHKFYICQVLPQAGPHLILLGIREQGGYA